MGITELIVAGNGFLLLLLSFFIKELLHKIGKTSDQLVSIDKSLALVAAEIKHFDNKFTQLDIFQEKTDKEIIKIRESIHEIKNFQNSCQLRHESED